MIMPIPFGQPQPPKPALKPGFLGKEGFKTFEQLKGFATKPSIAPPPGYEQKWTKQGRESLVKDLEKYSQLIGKTGVSERDIPWIIKKMQERENSSSTPWPEKKKIGEEIKMLEHYRWGGK